MPSDAVRKLLSTNVLFRHLEPDVVARIADLGTTRRLHAHQILFSKGDPGDALYGVVTGAIRISAGSPSGKEVILNIVGPGEVFGEIALLDGRPRTADATAMMNTELLGIRRSDFIRYMESEPRLATHLLDILCGRVRATSELVEDSAFLALPARLAKRLLSLSREPGEELKPPVDLKISQNELGQLMDSSREAVNRHLQSWRREGWVSISRNHVTILNPHALQDLVDQEWMG